MSEFDDKSETKFESAMSGLSLNENKSETKSSELSYNINIEFILLLTDKVLLKVKQEINIMKHILNNPPMYDYCNEVKIQNLNKEFSSNETSSSDLSVSNHLTCKDEIIKIKEELAKIHQELILLKLS